MNQRMSMSTGEKYPFRACIPFWPFVHVHPSYVCSRRAPRPRHIAIVRKVRLRSSPSKSIVPLTVCCFEAAAATITALCLKLTFAYAPAVIRKFDASLVPDSA